MKRSEARERAFQALFQTDNTDVTAEEALAHVSEGAPDPFCAALVAGTTERREEIDRSLKAHLEKWSLDRLPKAERTILRLAVYELTILQEAPPRVILNEAIELSKRFGDAKAGQFINGVLSKYGEALNFHPTEGEEA